MMTNHPYLKTIIGLLAGAGILFAVVHYGAGSLLPSSLKEVPAATAPTQSDNSGAIGQRAAYFDLPNIAGDHVRLSDYTDMPVVIVFWSTWNADAADQIKIIDDYLASDTSGSAFVKFIAIDSQEEHSIVASFMNRGGYTVPVVLDSQGMTTEAYHITSVPTFYFVDRDGIVRDVYSGVLNQKSIVDKVESLLR